METNKEQFLNEFLYTCKNTNAICRESSIKNIKKIIINTCNFNNKNINKEVLLPQCITVIDFLVYNDENLTTQECIDLQTILSNYSDMITKKIQTLKKQINNVIVEINNKTILENDKDYKAFKKAAPLHLTEDEIKNMYLKYKSK